jgi:hypothetical protein
MPRREFSSHHLQGNCSAVGRASGLPVDGASGSVFRGTQLRARGPDNWQTGGLPHSPKGVPEHPGGPAPAALSRRNRSAVGRASGLPVHGASGSVWTLAEVMEVW